MLRLITPLLVLFLNGCVLTSATMTITKDTYPEQEARVVSQPNSAGQATMRLLVGDGPQQIAYTLDASVGGTDPANYRVLGPQWSECACFRHGYGLGNYRELSPFRVEVRDGEEWRDIGREFPGLSVRSGAGWQVLAWVALPFTFALDTALLPFELAFLGGLIAQEY